MASVPTCTMTWYTSGSAASAIFSARNASAMTSSASARLRRGRRGPPGVRPAWSAAGVSAETPGSCAVCGAPGPSCGCSRSPAAARSAFSSTAPCSGGQPERPGQRSVLLETPGQAAPDPGGGVIGGADLAVGAGEPLQLVPGHRPGDLGQVRLGLRGGDPGQRADLGIRQPARAELRADHWQVPQRSGHPDVLPGRAGGHLALPRQPRRAAGHLPARPAAARVEVPEQGPGTGTWPRPDARPARRSPPPAAPAEPRRSPGSASGSIGTGVRLRVIEHEFDASTRV